MRTLGIIPAVTQKANKILPRFGLRKAPQTLAADMVEIKGKRFSPLVEELMKKVRAFSEEFGLEDVYIINKKGEVLDLDVVRTGTEIDIKKINGRNFDDAKDLLIGGILIHSHPFPVPLAGADICFMLENQLIEMIATTPKGFSSLTGKSRFSFRQDACLSDASIIGLAQRIRSRELGLIWNLKPNPKRVEEYSQFSIEEIGKFARKWRLKFTHQGF